MPRSTFLVVAAIIYALFGLGLLLAPGAAMAPYGLAFDASGALMARVLGSSLLAFALLLWLIRNGDPGSVAPVLWAGLAYNVIDLPVNVIAIADGVLNAAGWVPTLLHVFLAAGFGYFALQSRATARQA